MNEEKELPLKFSRNYYCRNYYCYYFCPCCRLRFLHV
jgi:hypothetical protein